jgi:hypothetical protein
MNMKDFGNKVKNTDMENKSLTMDLNTKDNLETPKEMEKGHMKI